MELTDFLHAGTISHKLKSDWKFFAVSMVKNGCDQSVDRTLKLTVSQEWADGINLFFAYWCMITKIKSWWKIFGVGMVKIGCDLSGLGTQKWTDRRRSFFHAVTISGELKAKIELFMCGGWSKMAMAC